MELDKNQQKVCQGLVETGMKRELRKVNHIIAQKIEEYRSGILDDLKCYQHISETVRHNDKRMAHRYAQLSSGDVVTTIALMVRNEVLNEDDLKILPTAISERIFEMADDIEIEETSTFLCEGEDAEEE